MQTRKRLIHSIQWLVAVYLRVCFWHPKIFIIFWLNCTFSLVLAIYNIVIYTHKLCTLYQASKQAILNWHWLRDIFNWIERHIYWGFKKTAKSQAILGWLQWILRVWCEKIDRWMVTRLMFDVLNGSNLKFWYFALIDRGGKVSLLKCHYVREICVPHYVK